MRNRLVMVVAIVLAVAAVAVLVSRLVTSGPGGPTAAHASLGATRGSYLGVYEADALASYQPIWEFTTTAGRNPNLAGYFSGWGELFKTGFATTARHHGAATLVQIDPTGASVAAIAAGDYDGYLSSYADEVSDFGHPVVIGFGHEMNAPWYSWGRGHLAPATFIQAWRHVVSLFRREGADNVTWLWTIQADIPSSGPIRSWWPGAKYVTWVGIDGYYYRPSNTFANVFGRTIGQVRAFTSKPILLSETSVGPKAGQGVKIPDLFRGMAAYQTLGLVWFDITQNQGIYHQDWRIEDSRSAKAAFRQSARRYLHY